MITFTNVRNRISSINSLGTFNENSVAIDLCKKVALDTHNPEYLTRFIESWSNIYQDQNQAFRSLLETVDEYYSENTNSKELKSSIYLINTKVLPSLKDIKINMEQITKFANKYDKSILETSNMYKQCDRVINNHKKLNLNNSKNFDNYIRENYITDIPESTIDCVNELCNIINSYDMPFRTKFTVALENILYGLDKLDGDCNANMVLDTIVSTFSQYDYDKSVVDMQDILSKNNFYTENTKSVVAYLYDNDYNDVYLEGKKITRPSGKGIIKALKELQLKKLKAPEFKREFKKILDKIYTKSAENILEDTPNMLTWIRSIFLLSVIVAVGTTVFTAIALGIAVILVDKFIQMGASRIATDKMLKNYKAEKAKVERKIQSSKGKKKEALMAYSKDLDESIDKLENYRDSLYTTKENDERRDRDYEASMNESFLNLDLNQLSTEDYFEDFHKDAVKDLYTIYNKLVEASAPMCPKFIRPVTMDDIKQFEHCGTANLYKYLDAESEIMVKIADWLCIPNRQELIKVKDTESEAEEFMRDAVDKICDQLTALTEGYSVIYDGDEDLWHIYAILNVTIIDPEDKIDKTTEDDIIKNATLVESLSYLSNNPIESLIENSISYLSANELKGLTNLLLETNIIDYTNIISIYKESKNTILNSSNDSSKYITSSILEDGIYKMTNKDTIESIDYLEEVNKIGNLIDNINESKLGDHAKVIASRAKNTAITLNTKQKTISNTMDGFVDRLKDKVQRELTNKSRESVIKGTVLPSLSTIIKMALASGATATLLHPVIGVIAFVGGLALSKRATAKEKQYILDEIEIQLKVVDKKIQLAENNNDMKAMEELLKIQQRLRQEKQRIIYNGQARNYRREHD